MSPLRFAARHVPFAEADAAYRLTQLADRFWGLDALFADGLDEVRVRPGSVRHHGALEGLTPSVGITVIDGDLTVTGRFHWRHAPSGPGSVLLVTGDVHVGALVLEGEPNLWVKGALKVDDLVLTALEAGGSLVVDRALAAKAWLQWQPRGEIRVRSAFRGRVIQRDERMNLTAFPKAERASAALSTELARPLTLDAVIRRFRRGLSVIEPTARPTGPTWKGRPLDLLTELSISTSREELAAAKKLPKNARFPALKSLVLGGCELNPVIAGWQLPELEALTVCGPHAPPGIIGVDGDDHLDPALFSHMPRLSRLRIQHFRALPEAVFTIPTLKSLDLAQELANPVFHRYPKPGLRRRDLARLRKERPHLHVAFADDVCRELPKATAKAIAELHAIQTLLLRASYAKAKPRALKLWAFAEKNRETFTDVGRFDIMAQLLCIHGCLGDAATGAAQTAHYQRQREVAELAMSEVGDPAGWFISTAANDACRELAMYASNMLAWELREKEPERALEIIRVGALASVGKTNFRVPAIFDTEARILLNLGRTEEAYAAARRGLQVDPSFAALQDIKRSRPYQRWLETAAPPA